MGLARAYSPVLHFDDINGRPLVGGKLYTYKSGTSTPATTFRDKDGHEANTNPILLNERGDCVVWLNDKKSYKFVLKDALDNTIWEADNVTIPAGEGGVAPSGDELWGHWVSGDVSGDWKIVNRGTPKNFEGVLKLKEGSINGIAIDTTLEDSLLDAGLYDYKLELAFNRWDSVDTREFASYDLEIYYGDQVLRAMTFCFRCDTTNNYNLTEWAAGVFKLENPGKIKIRVTANDNNDTYQHRLKVSHFFVHTID